MNMNQPRHYLLLSMILPLLAIGCQQENGSMSSAGSTVSADVEVNHAITTSAPPEITAVADSDWATLKGRIVYDGTAPARIVLKPNKDVATCGKTKLFDEELVVGADGGVADVFIWVVVKKGKIKVHPDYEKDAKATVRFTNKACRYEPHAMVVRAGQSLELGNDDDVGHNVNLPFMKNKPRNVLIPPNGSFSVDDLTKAERLPTGVACNIHPWMKGKLLVLDHPYGVVTDAEGNFEIKNLPAGTKLTFKAWHPAAGYVKDVEIDGKSEVWKRGQFKKTLKGDLDLGNISVKPAVFKK